MLSEDFHRVRAGRFGHEDDLRRTRRGVQRETREGVCQSKWSVPVAAVPRLERLQLAVHSLLYGMHRSGARDRVVDQAAGGKLEFAASPVSDEGPHEPLARGYGVADLELVCESVAEDVDHAVMPVWLRGLEVGQWD